MTSIHTSLCISWFRNRARSEERESRDCDHMIKATQTAWRYNAGTNLIHWNICKKNLMIKFKVYFIDD